CLGTFALSALHAGGLHHPGLVHPEESGGSRQADQAADRPLPARPERSPAMSHGTKPELAHEFTLVLTGVTELTRELEYALFEAGCDDATLCLQGGRVYLDFNRAGSTLEEAVASALEDVRRAGYSAAFAL